MPIFEYACRDCHNEFELLLLPRDTADPACPACQSTALEKQPLDCIGELRRHSKTYIGAGA